MKVTCKSNILHIITSTSRYFYSLALDWKKSIDIEQSQEHSKRETKVRGGTKLIGAKPGNKQIESNQQFDYSVVLEVQFYRVAFGASVSPAKENLQTAQPFMFLCQRDITVKRILHRLSVSNVCFVRFCGTATKAATGINLGTEIQFDPKRARELFIGAIRSPTLRYKSRGGTRTDVTISGVPWNWDRWCNYA